MHWKIKTCFITCKRIANSETNYTCINCDRQMSIFSAVLLLKYCVFGTERVSGRLETQVRFVTERSLRKSCLGPQRRTNSQPWLQHRKQHVITPACVCVWDSQRRTIRCSDAPLPLPWKHSHTESALSSHFSTHTHTHTHTHSSQCSSALRRPLQLQIFCLSSITNTDAHLMKPV